MMFSIAVLGVPHISTIQVPLHYNTGGVITGAHRPPTPEILVDRLALYNNDDTLKDILPQNKNFKVFLALCSPVNLLKHNIYALFGRLRQYFACFDCSRFVCAILLSCGIARPVIQAGPLVSRTGDQSI